MNTNKKMESVEIVRRAIEFDSPPRLPFWQHWNHKMPEFPDDVHNIWEMDRAEAGWFFDNPGMDDWGCGWSTTEKQNIGQVTELPAGRLVGPGELPTAQPPQSVLLRAAGADDRRGRRPLCVPHGPFAAVLATAQAPRLRQHDGGFLPRAGAGAPRAGHDRRFQAGADRRAAAAVRRSYPRAVRGRRLGHAGAARS